MSLQVALILGVVGLFSGSLCWVIARNLADGRLPFERLLCHSFRSIGGAQPCLGTFDRGSLLPLYGFGTQRRCRTCENGQSWWRLVVELSTAFYFVAAAQRVDDRLYLTSALLFSMLLIVILLLDFWTHLLFTNLLFGGSVLGLFFSMAEDGIVGFFRTIGAMAIAGAIFGFFYIFAGSIYKTVKVVPLGKGDIYLATMIAAMVGFYDLIKALFFGMLFVGIAATVLIMGRQFKTRQAMPYGPFLCLGAMVALIW